MQEYVPEKIPSCNVCGKELWFNRVMADGKEEWACPNRWVGPDLLKLKPRDPEWEKHTVIVRPPRQPDLKGLTNWPETTSVKEYMERALPGLIRK